MSRAVGASQVPRGGVKPTTRNAPFGVRNSNLVPSKNKDTKVVTLSRKNATVVPSSSSIYGNRANKPSSSFQVHLDENGEEVLNVVKQLERLDKETGKAGVPLTVNETRRIPSTAQSSCEAKPKRGRSSSPFAVEESVSEYGSVDDGGDSEYYSTRHETPSHSSFVSDDMTRDMYCYMIQREKSFRPRVDYMKKQSDLNENMRRVLVDWLSDVIIEFDMEKETLHLAVSLVDRLLSHCDVKRLQLQLAGTAALMIAAKYELIYPPELKDFAYVTDDSYTENQILKMERKLLSIVSFDVSVPTPHWFISYLLQLINADSELNRMCSYLADLSLLDYSFILFTPSTIACSSLYLGNLILERKEAWTEELEGKTGKSRDDLKECATLLLKAFRSAPSSEQKSMFDRYSEDKQGEVALRSVPSSLSILF